MTDTNELRRLAQAATPGPWYVTGKLTRYVEARIDGGLIQEVAACGPTKADGGYGPQQEANARLITAANPAVISELLDRLEAAEADALEQARLNGMGASREAALLAKLEAAEKERDFAKTEIARLHDDIRELTDVRVLDEEDRDRIVAWLQGTSTKPAPSVPDDVMRDAKRYRFLRAAKNIPISTEAARDPIVYDAAIDAAMLAAAPEAKT